MMRIVIIGCMVLAGCEHEREPATPPQVAAPPVTATPAPAEAEPAAAEPEVPEPEEPIAIPPQAAASEVRLAAVKRLLAGGPAVNELPEVSSDPQRPFDPGLADAMTPRGTIVRRVPRVRQGKAKVSRGLDKDIVRRIVRAHINEIRYCYNRALTIEPEDRGVVSIEFEIEPNGKVVTAKASKSTLEDPDIGACMSKAVKRWKFPKPVGGVTVEVLYPFHLEPG